LQEADDIAFVITGDQFTRHGTSSPLVDSRNDSRSREQILGYTTGGPFGCEPRHAPRMKKRTAYHFTRSINLQTASAKIDKYGLHGYN
jgi:hypothetical protein